MKRMMKRGLLVCIVALAAGLLFVAYMNYRAGKRMQAALDAVQQAGEPLTLKELSPKAVPPDENAATRLARLNSDLNAIEIELRPLHEEATNDQYYDGEALTQAGHDLISGVFEHFPNVCDQLMQAAEQPAYTPQNDFNQPVQQFLESQLTRVQTLRTPARILDYRAQMLLFEGKHQEAARCGLSALQWSRHFDREPLLISYLVSLAVRSIGLSILERSLAAGPMDEELYTAIDRELARHDDMSGLRMSLLSERPFGIANFREMFGGLRRSMWWTRNDLSDYLEMFATQLRIAAQPKHAVANQLWDLEQQLASAGTLTKLTAPALQATREAVERVRAYARCVRIINAAQAHAAKHSATPQDLAALDLPDEAKVDPYDGNPLRVIQSDEGWLVYALGRNDRDDNGQIKNFDDVGVGPIPIIFEQ